jgi:hypothetical protein
MYIRFQVPMPSGFSHQEVVLSSGLMFPAGSAGAILAQQSELSISDSTLSSCRAESDGGALVLFQSNATLAKATLLRNRVRAQAMENQYT